MIAIYIFQKLLSILILFRQPKLYGSISLFLFFVLFFFKQESHDVLNYMEFVGRKGSYELFFSGIIDSLNLIFNDKALVITIYQLILVGVASLITFYFKENKILNLAIIFSSIAMMLAVHNNLRQGTASIFILLGIISYIHGKRKTGILLTCTSLGFHHASIFFVFSIAALGLIYKFFISKKNFKKNYYILKIYYVVLIEALIATILIHYLINFIDFKIYLGKDIASVNTERVNHQLKVVLLFLAWLGSEFIIKFRSKDIQLDFMRYLRNFFLFFAIFLSFFNDFNEIANRILYFYYVVEMGLLCFFVDRKMFNVTVYMLIVYGFAFNVWNIIA